MSTEHPFTRGVLYANKSKQNYDLKRIAPSDKLATIVDTFWSVKWDLPDQQPHLQQNIPDPCVHMVFESGHSRVVGVVTKKFTRELANQGDIFGIKFRVGAFHALLKSPVSTITDKELRMTDVFPRDGDRLSENMLAANDIKAKIRIAENFLASFNSDLSNIVNRVEEIITEIEQDKSITKVDHLVERFSVNTRSLQRLFHLHVGVSPKWVIRKYRMQEALAMLEAGERDWQTLVSRLDYFDQAHFIRDFKALVGLTPSDYMSHLESNNGEGS